MLTFNDFLSSFGLQMEVHLTSVIDGLKTLYVEKLVLTELEYTQWRIQEKKVVGAELTKPA